MPTDTEGSHAKALRSAMFQGAVQRAADYKLKHPDAKRLMVRVETLAFSPKPPGYVSFLIRLADEWLSDAASARATNVATVDAIRRQFPGHSFAANLLNKPLSKRTLEQISESATAKGLRIDTRRHNTMSKIKAAIRAGERPTHSDRQWQIESQDGDRVLRLCGLSFKVHLHGNADCIRFKAEGKSHRLPLDALAALLAMLDGEAPGGSPSSLVRSTIGKGGPKAEKTAGLRGNGCSQLETTAAINGPRPDITVIGGQDHAARESSSLSERIKRVRAAISETHPPPPIDQSTELTLPAVAAGQPPQEL